MVVVDPHRTGPHLLRDLERLSLVARPNRAAEAVDRVVGHTDRVVDVLVADHAQDGAEDLALARGDERALRRPGSPSDRRW